MKILISTDTSCLISYDALKKYEISVFPLNVIIDGVEYLDGVTIKQDELKEAMRSNKAVKTSTPPYGEIIDYFEKLFEQGYDHIIHFTISSKLSSMNSLFNTVSKNDFDNKITVIDSYAVSSLMLSQVLLAYDELQKGSSIEEICKKVEQVKNDNYVCFVPENLNALKNGGRVSPALAAIANTIGIKPLILLKDGELVKDTMIKNTKKAFSDRFDEMIAKYPDDRYDYCLIGFDANQNTFEYIENHIRTTIIDKSLVTGLIPINVCAHCGPGTIGLLVTPKINGKSLSELI